MGRFQDRTCPVYCICTSDYIHHGQCFRVCSVLVSRQSPGHTTHEKKSLAYLYWTTSHYLCIWSWGSLVGLGSVYRASTGIQGRSYAGTYGRLERAYDILRKLTFCCFKVSPVLITLQRHVTGVAAKASKTLQPLMKLRRELSKKGLRDSDDEFEDNATNRNQRIWTLACQLGTSWEL